MTDQMPVSGQISESAPGENYTSPYSALLAVVLVISLLILAQNAVTDILNHFSPLKGSFYNSQEYRDYNYELNKLRNQRPFLKIPNHRDYATQEEFEEALRKYDEVTSKERGLYNKYYSLYENRIVPSPSFRLMLHALMVLPFWLITLFLFINLKEDRKRYESLLFSYFVTSGWLLIFLLFNVAKYIYNSNTVLGVYIVLGLIVAVLTGVIWAVQKYRHGQLN